MKEDTSRVICSQPKGNERRSKTRETGRRKIGVTDRGGGIAVTRANQRKTEVWGCKGRGGLQPRKTGKMKKIKNCEKWD